MLAKRTLCKNLRFYLIFLLTQNGIQHIFIFCMTIDDKVFIIIKT